MPWARTAPPATEITLGWALANALVAAYKRRPDAAEEAVVTIDPESGEIRVYGQDFGFGRPERRLPPGRKELGHRHTRLRLDVGVGVPIGPAE